jgi:hypothetical protein
LNQELLKKQTILYNRRSSSVNALLELGPDVSAFNSSQLESHWKWVIRGGSYDPSTGVLETALNMGSISLIRDSELRTLLTSWSGQLEDLAGLESRIARLIFDQMVP